MNTSASSIDVPGFPNMPKANIFSCLEIQNGVGFAFAEF